MRERLNNFLRAFNCVFDSNPIPNYYMDYNYSHKCSFIQLPMSRGTWQKRRKVDALT